jgi:hypothetical protein
MEQGGPEQDITDPPYGNSVPYEAIYHCNADWAMHRNTPPIYSHQECNILPESNAAYQPYFSTGCPAPPQVGQSSICQPAIVEYSRYPQECTPPIYCTSSVPYPSSNLYQPIAAHATVRSVADHRSIPIHSCPCLSLSTAVPSPP